MGGRRAQAHEKLGHLKSSLQDLTAACFLEKFENHVTVGSADRVLKEIGKQEATQRMKTLEPLMPSKYFVQNYLTSFKQDEEIDMTEQDSDNMDGDAYYRKALRQIKKQEYEQAFESLTQAIENNTTKMAKALSHRGAFLRLRGEFTKAHADLD